MVINSTVTTVTKLLWSLCQWRRILLVLSCILVVVNQEDIIDFEPLVQQGIIDINITTNTVNLTAQQRIDLAYKPQDSIYPSLYDLGARNRTYCPNANGRALKKRKDRYKEKVNCPAETTYTCVDVDPHGPVKFIEFCGPDRNSCKRRERLVVVYDPDNRYAVQLKMSICPPTYFAKHCYDAYACHKNIEIVSSNKNNGQAYCNQDLGSGYCNKYGSIYFNFMVDTMEDVCIPKNDPDLEPCAENEERLADCSCGVKCQEGYWRMEENGFSCPTIDGKTPVKAAVYPTTTENTSLKKSSTGIPQKKTTKKKGSDADSGSGSSDKTGYYVLIGIIAFIGVVVGVIVFVQCRQRRDKPLRCNGQHYSPVGSDAPSVEIKRNGSESTVTVSEDSTPTVVKKIVQKGCSINNVKELNSVNINMYNCNPPSESGSSVSEKHLDELKKNLTTHAQEVLNDVAATNISQLDKKGVAIGESIQQIGRTVTEALEEEKEKVVADTRDEMTEDAFGIIRDTQSEVRQTAH